MTGRQRFHETMRYGSPDRVPYFEEGIRKEVIKTWHRQGLSRKTDISTLFKSDPFYEIELGFDPLSEFGRRLTSREELSSLRKDLSPGYFSRLRKKWQKMTRVWRRKEHVLFLRVHRGFFLSMGVYDWRRFTDVISLLTDDPEFVREAMGIQGELISKFLDTVLQEMDVDAVLFSEPIGGNSGPLISPKMYEEFVLKSYRPIIEITKKHGIETIILRTYANIRVLIPCILKNGFNCLWACETNSSDMDYTELRNKFGSNLRLIGGIDLDTLRDDKHVIRREMESKVLPLITSGGYIPIADGRVRKNIPFENYAYYRRLLQQMIENKRRDLS